MQACMHPANKYLINKNENFVYWLCAFSHTILRKNFVKFAAYSFIAALKTWQSVIFQTSSPYIFHSVLMYNISLSVCIILDNGFCTEMGEQVNQKSCFQNLHAELGKCFSSAYGLKTTIYLTPLWYYKPLCGKYCEFIVP